MYMNDIKFAIIGGSGFYDIETLPTIKEIYTKTKYGLPSDSIKIKESNGVFFAFVPRHGFKHNLPPHKIPYKANIELLKEIGVTNIIGICIAGSLKSNICPSDFVIPNQFVNFTWGRDDDFIDGEEVEHLPFANPYCIRQNEFLYKILTNENINTHIDKTVTVIQGTRFSTIAEANFFSSQGWDIINMTQYPEVYYARKAGICYSGISMITDFDSSLKKEMSIGTDLSIKEVLNTFKMVNEKIKSVIISNAHKIHDFSVSQCVCKRPYPKEYYKTN